jgi:hypothetical protein
VANRDLNVKIDGDPKGFQAAAAKAQAAAKRLEQSLTKMEAKQRAGQKSAALLRGELVTLGAAGAAISPAFAAAGAGVAAFGALAVPSIMKVVKAQQDMAKTWDSLSTQERTSAAGLRQLIGQYKDLARSVEPDVLRTFNAGLSLTGSLMPRLAPMTAAVSRELTAFINESEAALNGDRAQKFFNFLEREAAPSVDALGDALGSGAHLAASLVESLAPLATAGLGAVSMFAKLLATISDVSPELAQLTVLGIGLRGPLTSLGEMVGRTSERYKDFAGKAKGAGLATKALNLVTAAGPNLYVAAGVALAFLATKALSAKSSTDTLVESLSVANRASGNNIAGYKAMNAALAGELSKSIAASNALVEQQGKTLQGVGGRVPVVNQELHRMATAQNELKDAIAESTRQLTNVTSGADALAEKYGLSRAEALRLADAVGVDLSRGILTGGEITASVAAKFDRYRLAVEMARDPTAVISQAWADASNSGLTLEERVKGINNAMNAFFNPSIAVYNATTAMEEAFDRAKEAIGRSRGALDAHSATSRAARDAFAGALEKVRDTATATYTYTSVTRGATAAADAQRAAVLKQLPELARLAGSNRSAQGQVAALAHSFGITGNQAVAAGVKVQSLITAIRRLQNKTVTITYIQRGTGASPRNPGTSREFHAAGGYISGPGTSTSDSIPAMLSDGEYVVNARATARHRELLEAINAGRYARGGMVRGYAAGGMVRGYAVGGLVDAPLSDFVSRFMDGKPLSKADYAKAVRARADAVAQLRRAERKLAEDRKAHRSARTIADDEARVAKERRDLLTATEKLTAATLRYKRSKLSPVARLTASLDLGIKNSSAFIKNLETIAKRGYPELARQLLAMGGPEAEKYAAGAAKLSGSKLKSLAGKVATAAKNQARLEALPDILAVKAARKAGAKNIPEVMRRTGLSEDEIRDAYAAMGYARGGIHRYARGGVRPGPGIATRPTVLFGEGRGPEGFVPYDPAHRQRAMGLVSQMARDFGMTRAGAGGCHCSVTIDVTGADSHMLRMIRSMVRVKGRGNVQVAFGKAG